MEKIDTKKVLPEKSKHIHAKRKMSPFGHIFRLFGWWFGFTGLYSMFAVCPFCGQQGCPVGIASAGSVGAFFALCIQDWKRLFAFLKFKIFKKSKNNISSNEIIVE